MQNLRAVLDDAVRNGVVPSASLALRVGGVEVFHHTTGMARLDPPRPALDDQPYDLASVTKVLAGTAVVASLVEEGALALDTPVAEHLGPVDPRVTVLHLLQHSSGLAAWNRFYEQTGGASFGTALARQRVFEQVLASPVEVEPGTRHTYSDIGFLWLLILAERVGGEPFAQLFHDRVTVPSRVADLRWSWPLAAATEWPCPYRQVGVEGIVHDLNCASLGGVSTHAGLFGTARAVAQLGEAFMRAAAGDPAFSGLPGRTLARLWSLEGVGSHKGGWDGVSTGGYTSTGQHWPADGVGHLGYTGTSIWMSPSRETVVALLTNRVHPVDDKEPIRQLRPVVHDAVAEALGWV
ncbi:MAG: beta-lactamase family protein [Alphaproteobacteria bacterium]|nr:beta-lactamase family protein [Alphaproteobacteria bacterium]MCB9692718.1 beta-lactamase family protein [Alphaproteobacteria bacterium]